MPALSRLRRNLERARRTTEGGGLEHHDVGRCRFDQALRPLHRRDRFVGGDVHQLEPPQLGQRVQRIGRDRLLDVVEPELRERLAAAVRASASVHAPLASPRSARPGPPPSRAARTRATSSASRSGAELELRRTKAGRACAARPRARTASGSRATSNACTGTRCSTAPRRARTTCASSWHSGRPARRAARSHSAPSTAARAAGAPSSEPPRPWLHRPGSRSASRSSAVSSCSRRRRLLRRLGAEARPRRRLAVSRARRPSSRNSSSTLVTCRELALRGPHRPREPQPHRS